MKKYSKYEQQLIDNFRIYPSRYLAKKAAWGDEVVVKVDGGYAIMSATEYRVWRNQK